MENEPGPNINSPSRKVWVAFYLLICPGSGVALWLLLPWLKEGFGIEQLPLFAGTAVGLFITILIWFRFASGRLRFVGIFFLFSALMPYLLLCWDLATDEWQGRRIGRQMKIRAFTADPIEWPGFEGPVGIRLEIELAHPVVKGFLWTPKIAMTGRTDISRMDYFYNYYNDYERGFLTSPDIRELESGTSFERTPPIRVVYELFPGILRRTPENAQICIAESSNTFSINYTDDGENGVKPFASWWFYETDGAWVDLSPLLTREIQAAHLWPGVLEWTGMLKRMEPDGLHSAGYMPCPEKQTFAGETCFCRSLIF